MPGEIFTRKSIPHVQPIASDTMKLSLEWHRLTYIARIVPLRLHFGPNQAANNCPGTPCCCHFGCLQQVFKRWELLKQNTLRKRRSISLLSRTFEESGLQVSGNLCVTLEEEGTTVNCPLPKRDEQHLTTKCLILSYASQNFCRSLWLCFIKWPLCITAKARPHGAYVLEALKEKAL